MKRPVARKLPSGAWRVQLMVDGRKISITDASRKVAEAKAYAMKAGVMDIKKHPEHSTLGAAIDMFISDRENVLSPSTIKAYKSYRQHRFQDYMDYKVCDLDRRTLQKMVNEESVQVSPKTVKNAWTLMTAALKDYDVETEDINLPAAAHNEKAFLDYEQIKVFLKAIEDKPGELIALLALHSLRRSEIYALQWKDIDLNKKTITVAGAAVFNDEGELIRKETNKTAASRRTVPIVIPRLYELLSKADKTEELIAGHINSSYFQINKVCERNGLPQVGLHGLRHSFASLCHHLGVPEMECARMGGWNDLNTMRNIYTHIAEKEMENTAAKLADYFSL